MRTDNSIKNISMSMLSQIVIVLLGLVSRKVFINSLGTEYLGINGLLMNVLSMLALVESGIGTSIVYNLYKPLAEKDEEKVVALVQLYKKAYSILALITLGLSLVIYPIVIKIINVNEDIGYITIVYFIFVIRNLISYLYAHKWSLINADQKGYVLGGINIIFNMITLIMRILILSITQSYILYLIIEIIIMIGQNIFNGRIVDKRYSYIKAKAKYKVDKSIKDNITQNVRALFLHNIGGYCVNGTDNLLIGAFISVKMVGLYSNYTMIIGQLASLLSPILGGINASVGNLIATESEKKAYEVFKVIYLVNFIIYSLATIFLFNLLEPFINWWLGTGLLVDKFTFAIVLVNFYLSGMRISISTFKNKAGIFVQDRYMPLVEAVINLGVSIILVKQLGLVGIFLGTTISTLCTVFWNVPRLVYKNVFKKSIWEYFKQYILYVFIVFGVGCITTLACSKVVISQKFLELVLKGIICVSIPSICYFGLFYRTEEFTYLLNVMKEKKKVLVNKLNVKITKELL